MTAATVVRARRARWTLLVLTLAAEALAFAIFLHRTDLAHHSLLLAVVTMPLFLLAIVQLAALDLAARATTRLVLAGGAVFELIALTQQPLTSDDDYRYIWDGRVQLAGIDPYRYAPVDPHLSRLRDHLIFGAPAHCGHLFTGGCTAINRPSVHTVYPPVAQGLFVLVRLASFGGHGGRLPFQIAGAIGALAVGVLLARATMARGRPLWLVALWAWSPVTVSEFANNAHIDWLAVALVVAALTAAAGGRSTRAGILIGAAVATKVYPFLVLPSLLRRHARAVLGAAAVVIVLGYVPHVIAVGTKVVGYLPGYLHEEGYSSGSRLLLLGAVLPDHVDVVVGALLGGAVAVWAWRRSDPDDPAATAVVVAGAAFLIATPNYGWYAALLVALIVLSGSWEWMPVALAPTITYLYRHDYLHTGIPSSVIYLIAALLTLALFRLRTRTRKRNERDAVTSSTGTPCPAPGSTAAR